MKSLHFSFLCIIFWVISLTVLILTRIAFLYQPELSTTWQMDVITGLCILVLLDVIVTRRKLSRASGQISELKAEMNWMKESIDFYATLDIATREIHWETNLNNGKSAYANKYLTEVLGYSAEEVQKQKDWWENNLHPEDREVVIRKFNDAIEQGKKTCQAEYRFRCKDGSYRVILDNSHIFRDEANNAYRLIGSMQDITEHRGFEEKLALQKMDHELKMREAVIHAQDIERHRISEELHDNVCQLLLSAKIFATHAKKNWELRPEDRKLLNLITDTISHAFEETRALSHNLNNQWLENHNLTRLIDNLCDQSMKANGFQITCDIGDIDCAWLTSHQKLTIYRVIQEQLSNIAKHAGASLVTISISIVDNELCLYISDNGKGFDTHSVKGGIGLCNMQHRVESCQGKITIDSSPGQGTRLQIRLRMDDIDSINDGADLAINANIS